MKRFLMLPAIAFLALGLAACQSLSGSTSPSDLVSRIQTEAIRYCNFVPHAQTIVAISQVQNKTIDTVSDYAVAICTAVRNSTRPTVEGVPVKAATT